MNNPYLLTVEYFEEMAKTIASNIPVERIFLFGSQASGNTVPDSDVDLLIIQKANASNKVIRKNVDALFRGRNFPMDIIVCRKEEFEMNIQAGHPLFLEILNKGRVLYE